MVQWEASTLALNPENEVQGESKDFLLSPTMSLAKVEAKKLIVFSPFTILNLPFTTGPVTRRLLVHLADLTPGPRQQVCLGQVQPRTAVVTLAGLERGQQHQSGVLHGLWFAQKNKPNCWRRDSKAFVTPTAKHAPRSGLIRCHLLTQYFMEGFCSVYGRRCWWCSGVFRLDLGYTQWILKVLQ